VSGSAQASWWASRIVTSRHFSDDLPRPLGPIDATFYVSEHENGRFGARLLFNGQKQQ